MKWTKSKRQSEREREREQGRAKLVAPQRLPQFGRT